MPLSKLMSQPLKVAGFEVTLNGRFCLTPEVRWHQRPLPLAEKSMPIRHPSANA